MRDPERIPRILETLRATWTRYPDMRLGQLIQNALDLTTTGPDLFYIEDDALIVRLIEFFQKHPPAKKNTPP